MKFQEGRVSSRITYFHSSACYFESARIIKYGYMKRTTQMATFSQKVEGRMYQPIYGREEDMLSVLIMMMVPVVDMSLKGADFFPGTKCVTRYEPFCPCAVVVEASFAGPVLSQSLLHWVGVGLCHGPLCQ